MAQPPSELKLNPFTNSNLDWLYCPDCGKKLAVFNKENGLPANTYPYCNRCRDYKVPVKHGR